MHPLTVWLALAGSIWSLFACAEDHLTPTTRADMSAWLNGRSADWSGTFGILWDSVFQAVPQTSSRGLRACVASQVTAFLLLCLSGVLYPGTSGIMLLVFFLYAPLLLALLVLVNLLPGYLSLRVNRQILQAVRQGPAARRLLLWLALTGLATCLLALLAWALGFLVVHLSSKAHLLRHPVTWISGYVEFVLKGGHGSLSALLEAAQLRPILVPGIAFPSFGIWLYTPCFPLIWGWLYLLSGFLLRRATAGGLLRSACGSGGLLDTTTRPAHALGAVAVGLMSVVYWSAMYLGRA